MADEDPATKRSRHMTTMGFPGLEISPTQKEALSMQSAAERKMIFTEAEKRFMVGMHAAFYPDAREPAPVAFIREVVEEGIDRKFLAMGSEDGVQFLERVRNFLRQYFKAMNKICDSTSEVAVCCGNQ